MRVNCRDCDEGKHGACIGEALVEFENGDVGEVECFCAGVQHLPSPEFPDAADTPIDTDPWSGLHLYGCAVCKLPTESEPCREHQPNAWAQVQGEVYLDPVPSPHRESDVPLWGDENHV